MVGTLRAMAFCTTIMESNPVITATIPERYGCVCRTTA